jgi:hypothetical protein
MSAALFLRHDSVPIIMELKNDPDWLPSRGPF